MNPALIAERTVTRHPLDQRTLVTLRARPRHRDSEEADGPPASTTGPPCPGGWGRPDGGKHSDQDVRRLGPSWDLVLSSLPLGRSAGNRRTWRATLPACRLKLEPPRQLTSKAQGRGLPWAQVGMEMGTPKAQVGTGVGPGWSST